MTVTNGTEKGFVFIAKLSIPNTTHTFTCMKVCIIWDIAVCIYTPMQNNWAVLQHSKVLFMNHLPWRQQIEMDAWVFGLLSVPLEHVDRVDGRVSEVPQPEGGVPGRGDYQTLGGVCAAVGQLLVVPWRDSSTQWGAYTPPFFPSCLSFFLKAAILTLRNVFQRSYTAPSPV